VEEARPVAAKGPAPMRMSSCTKEKVDAILIHCGRLSLSSSGTGMAASGETGGGGHRRHTGAKRSCDFDRERSDADEEGDLRGFPCRGRRITVACRRGSGRGAGRGPTGAAGGRAGRPDGVARARPLQAGGAWQQPGKMVSVLAREKGPAAAARTPGPGRGAHLRVRACVRGWEQLGMKTLEGGRRQRCQCRRFAGDCPGRPSSRRSGTAPWSRWIRIPSARITAAAPR
jgi:hypothetical protein